jgi:peptidoglycan/LPS O-acetylase OafA/YrhL
LPVREHGIKLRMNLTKSEAKPTSSNEHLAALDVLRGLAIIAVIWHHFSDKLLPAGWWMQAEAPIGIFGSALSNGWLGVNLFFILSGFVLYLPFADGRRAISARKDLLGFYKRRAKRLLPLYFFSVFLLFGLVGHSTVESVFFLSTLTFTFTKSYFHPEINWVLWSLGIEVWFSLIFPLVIFSVKRFGWNRTALIILSASLLIRLFGAGCSSTGSGVISILNPIKDSLIGRLDDFFIGMMLAHLHACGFRTTHSPLLLIVGLLVWMCAGVYSDFILTRHLPIWSIAFTNSIFQIGTCLIVLAALSRNCLKFWVLELLGMMCYSLYIWHGVLMTHLSPYPHTGGKTKFIVILLIVSWISYRYIEFGHVKQVSELLPRTRIGFTKSDPT